MRLCYFCYEDGDNDPAQYAYQPEHALEPFDVCHTHLELVKQLGLDYWELDDDEIIKEMSMF
jgi:hypothetical protein